MFLATQTLTLIDSKLEEDQGAKYRGLLGELMPEAGDAYSTKNDPFRDHLGASMIGRECARELWYNFHWCKKPVFSGRILRLFNTGHLAEPKIVALLKMIGCEVWQFTPDGKQYRVKGHKGHFGGSLDAVVRGIPEMPEVPLLAEFKTHGTSSYNKLVKEGVLKAKWVHLVQMQIYMGKYNLTHALYVAVEKNTDALYAEIVQFDPGIYQRYLDRSIMIIEAIEPPPKINENIAWFECRCCDYKGICHRKELPEINCRTCVFSRILENGKWDCLNSEASIEFPDRVLTPDQQRIETCPFHQLKPTFTR